MKIIDIFDNGGFRSAADDMLGGRFLTLSREMPMAAIRRQGPVAMTLAESGSVELLTSEFGFGVFRCHINCGVSGWRVIAR